MLKNFWYAIAFADEVTTTPRQLRVLGQDLVVFRPEDGAEPVVMSDLCVHRGGALSDGVVKDGRIQCPYHGWQYKPDGACSLIPANRPGTSIPKKARVDSYPVVERYRWVWAFLGDLCEADRPPIPDLQFFDDPGFRAISGQAFWNANYERVVENGIDYAHASFVHAGTFGNPNDPVIPAYDVDSTEWSVTSRVTLPEPAEGMWRRLLRTKGSGGRNSLGIAVYMPNIVMFHIDFSLGKLVIYDTAIPVDEGTTLIKWVALRSFIRNPIGDRLARRVVKKVFREDQRVVERLRPELLPFDIRAELHHKSDAMALGYRKIRDRCLQMGWGIDRHELAAHGPRRRATVIPSPARREVPELKRAWVMKEVARQPFPVPDDDIYEPTGALPEVASADVGAGGRADGEDRK